jgi:RNA polymerase sigma-70 factor, ECF subfamily
MKIETITRQPVADQSRATQFGQPAEILDEALVARVLEGDRGAFELLIRKHQGPLFRRARWMGLDADTAADMVQDTLIKAYTNLASCRDPNRFGYWVGQILRNRILDFLKSADRRNIPLSFSLPATCGDPEVEEARSTLRTLLQQALATLAPEQREAFLMKHGEGFSYEEMAELAETSVSAMKMRVHRARETLRDYFRDGSRTLRCDPEAW